jgi:hypothetical protein
MAASAVVVSEVADAARANRANRGRTKLRRLLLKQLTKSEGIEAAPFQPDALEVHFGEFPKSERAVKDKSNPLHRWLMFLDEKLPNSDEFKRELAKARARAQSDWVKKGMDPTFISKVTGFTVPEIDRLTRENA